MDEHKIDFENKRRKLDCNGKQKSFNRNLIDIFKLHAVEHVAIEYYDIESSKIIKYSDINNAIIEALEILKDLTDYQFIGINYDIPNYCIPSLILGILSKGHGFVYLPLEVSISRKFIQLLNVNYVFAKACLHEADIICEYVIHEQKVFLIKLKHDCTKLVKNDINFAYAIATSGSTGESKIVKVSHGSILPNIIDLKKILEINECDKIAQITNLEFDPSLIEIFLSFACGSTLFLPSDNLRNDPQRLLQIMYKNKVTFLQITPSLLFHRWSFRSLSKTIFSENSSLKVLLLGGEIFPNINKIRKIKHLKNITRIFNIYGITEISCWASINEINLLLSDKDHSSDLGTTLSETIFEVRDENNEIIKDGSKEGSLYIGDLVQVVKGKIFYRGRKGMIIKRFGNKLNLQKLEDIVSQLDHIKQCHSIWDKCNHKLHLIITTVKDFDDISEMRKNILDHLKQLPSIYQPDKIHFINNIKLTRNGKVCGKFLEQLCEEEESAINKDAEKCFRNLWEEFLIRSSKGFLELGGTSLNALQISSTVSEMLNLTFPELIGMMLRNSTFEECSNYVINQIKKKDYYCKEESIRFDNGNSYNSLLKEAKFSHPWQKCRGKSIGSRKNKKNETYGKISNIAICHSYDLKKCVDASPTLFESSEGKQYVTVGSHSGIIFTCELSDEKDAETYQMKLPDRIEASILIIDDFIGIIGCYDNKIYCVNIKSGQIIWSYKTENIIKCTAILCAKTKLIFFGSYDYHVYCLNVNCGSKVWKVKPSNSSITCNGCFHSSTNTVLFGTLNGTCVALKKTTGEIFWKHKLQDPIFSAPVVFKNGLACFCSVNGTISCFNIEANYKIWSYRTNGNIFAHLVLKYDFTRDSEKLIATSMNKNVYILENVEQKPKTKIFQLDGPIFATPWIDDDLIIVNSTNGSCTVMNLLTGERLSNIKLPADTFSSPIMHNQLIGVGCRDNCLYILKLQRE
ncbi:beta-alanine-activating enzyme isoform X2 [Prorops nasuta]|uniref:beta-alanine-activating enzyme isoform X2 n=1 Tax=Prorops nasuta TaxID=863751 RepID=UPI0034CFC415